MGDKVEFRCIGETTFLGLSRDSTCLESGNWSNPVPRCLTSCPIPVIDKATDVSFLQDDNTGNWTTKVQFGAKVSHGSFINVTCGKNSELDEEMDGDNIIRAPVCQNGTWSYVPKCRPASCKAALPVLKNGRIITTSIEHGSKGYMRCLDGFKLVGQNTIQCLRGNWSATNSSCVEIYCGFPGVIENGRLLLVGLTGMYDYKPYIRRTPNNRQVAYECDSGYRLVDGAPNGATCINGQWKPDGLPTCQSE